MLDESRFCSYSHQFSCGTPWAKSSLSALWGNALKITQIKATTVSVPLEAPLWHASGAHGGRFMLPFVEVEADEGLVGPGEMGSVCHQG